MSSRVEARLEQISRERLRAGIGGPPERLYALFPDEFAAPALYVEVAPDDTAPSVPFVVHNLRYYEDGMRRWDASFVELLVLNELHELTHWAMTDAERERFDEMSRRSGRPDGYWLNPVLFDLIGWLPGDPPEVLEPRPSPLERLATWVRDSLLGDRDA